MKKLNFSILVCAILGASAIQAAELAEIQARKEVKIGVRMSLYPFSKQNEDGSFEGFEVEFAKKLSDLNLRSDSSSFLFFSCKGSHCDVVVWFVEVWQEE